MDYLSALFRVRIWKAIASGKFWREGFLVFALSGIGIWWPWWFEWDGYESILNPEPWFTYGLATLMIVLGQRLFMHESEDIYILPNKLILAALTLLGGILYGKSVIKYFSFEPSGSIRFDYSLTKYAIAITLLSWFIHFVGKNEYDNEDPRNAIGGN